MSDDLVKRIKDRGDWLVDAVAASTQNRQFLRGEPECDDVACEAIRMNGEMAMRQIAKPLADRVEELEANLAEQIEWVKQLADGLIAAEGREARLKEKLVKVISLADAMGETIEDQIDTCDASMDEQIAVKNYRAALAELTGGKDE